MSELDQLIRGRSPYYSSYAPWRFASTLREIRGLPSKPLGYWTRVTSVDPNALFSASIALRSIGLGKKVPLSLYEDRRFYHPEGKNAWPVSRVTSNPKIVEQPFWRGIPYDPNTGEIRKLVPFKHDPSGYRYLPDRPGVLEKGRLSTQFAWENPWKMIICLKRKIRREVLNALGIAGKTGFKKPRYTQFSYVRCF